jgi:hypothetical protein
VISHVGEHKVQGLKDHVAVEDWKFFIFIIYLCRRLACSLTHFCSFTFCTKMIMIADVLGHEALHCISLP